MVNIKLGLLPKIQAQSKKFSYLINHAKIVETKMKHTKKSEGLEAIQVMTQVMPTVVIVISIHTNLGLVICKNTNSNIIKIFVCFIRLVEFYIKRINESHIISKMITKIGTV